VDCDKCPDQPVCEAQNKQDMARIGDVILALDQFDWNQTKDLLVKYKKTLIFRNQRITGR
jgi:hypothetical protein